MLSWAPRGFAKENRAGKQRSQDCRPGLLLPGQPRPSPGTSVSKDNDAIEAHFAPRRSGTKSFPGQNQRREKQKTRDPPEVPIDDENRARPARKEALREG